MWTNKGILTKESNSDLFESFKGQIETNKLLPKTISMSALEVIDEQTVAIQSNTQNVHLKLSTQAYKDLIQLLGLTNKVLNTFEKAFDREARKKLILLIKKGLSQNGNSITIYVDNNRIIQKINTTSKARMSNTVYLKLLEDILADSGDLQITNHSSNGLSSIVNLVNTKQNFSLTGVSNETYNFGITVENDIKTGITVYQNNLRLVCTNGAISKDVAEQININSEEVALWSKFHESIKELKSNNYIPTNFFKNVERMNSHKASVFEMTKAYQAIKKFSDVGDDADLFIPLGKINSRYKDAGIDLAGRSEQALRSAETNMTVYELFNNVTDFASHKYNYEVSDDNRFKLQVYAGGMINKAPDLSEIITAKVF